MSVPNQKHYFFPYLRRGLGARIPEIAAAVDEKRVSLDVSMRVNVSTSGDETEHIAVSQKVSLYGPGDVLGFDANKVISKTYPVLDEGSFFANNVPFVEFGEPDFPWRYSSTQITRDGHKNWIPWITLIVLKMKDTGEEGEFDFQPKPDGLPGRITVKKEVNLPDLQESWRWAHVYLMAEAGKSKNQLRTIIKTQPNRANSRLFSARKLESGKKYCAFVVPTYALGLEAGVGQDISQSASNRSALAWTEPVTSAGMELPYYYKWEFRTGRAANADGIAGDFEALVQAIAPRKLEDLGGRKINIDNPGYGIDNGGLTIEIEGALRSADKAGLSDEDRTRINAQADKVAKILKTIDTGEKERDNEPKYRVVPPIYGRWINNSEIEQVSLTPTPANADGNNPDQWLEQLNLDLRYRIAAGLGVRYIKENQESLIKAAWTHLKKVKEENQKRNIAKAGREISARLYKRISVLEDPSSFLAFSAPVLPKLSRFDSEAASRTTTTTTTNATTRGLRATPTPILFSTRLPESVLPALGRLRISGTIGGIKPDIRANTVGPKIPIGGIETKPAQPLPPTTEESLSPSVTIDLSDLSNTFLNSKIRKYKSGKNKTRIPLAQPATIDKLKTNVVMPPTLSGKGLTPSRRKQNFNVSDRDIRLNANGLTEMQREVREAISPEKTIEAKLLPSMDRWALWEERVASKKPGASTNTRKRDPLEPAISYPEFHQPTYKHLLAMSEEYFLPGLDKVPQNTCSVLVTNRKFIEAFLMGLNHEFASELRWRGYPTDLRGSYFRKFWDTSIFSVDEEERKKFTRSQEATRLLESLVSLYNNAEEEFQAEYKGTPPSMADRESSFKSIQDYFFQRPDDDWTDIISTEYEAAIERWLLTREEDKEIATFHSGVWDPPTELGKHPTTGSIQSTDANEVVIMLRADLLRKYPNTLIYLIKREELTQVRDDSDSGNEAPRTFPIFEAELTPDIVLLGFPISKSKAKEDYLVVFEERVFQPRLGLDATKARTADDQIKVENLSWKHFPTVEEGQYLDSSSPENNAASSDWSSSAHIARAFTQRPVRMAIDLASMLPK